MHIRLGSGVRKIGCGGEGLKFRNAVVGLQAQGHTRSAHKGT